jgi:hypothetical protein
VTVNTDPEQEQEWLRQNNLIYGGLIGIGVVLVQPFLTAPSLDLSATICVVAFSVAVPLLGALVLVNRQEVFRRRVTRWVTVEIARVVAQLCAAAGMVAGFWHIHRIAGVVVLAGGLVGIGVHSAGYVRLELKDPATPSPALLARLPAWRRPCCCRCCCRWPSCGLSHVRKITLLNVSERHL